MQPVRKGHPPDTRPGHGACVQWELAFLRTQRSPCPRLPAPGFRLRPISETSPTNRGTVEATAVPYLPAVTKSSLRVLQGAIRLDSGAGQRGVRTSQRGTIESLWQEHYLILNAVGDGIYGLDLEGRATFVNPAAAAMTGHQVDELLGKTMHEIVHHSRPDGHCYPRNECPIYAAFHDGLIRKVGDEVFWRKDGTSFPVEYTSTPIIESHRVVGAVVVFRDVTVRKLTEERLRHALNEVESLKEQLQEENRFLKQQIQGTELVRRIIGQSPGLAQVLELVRRAAPTDATVLVEGESGTGKELVCRAIHELGPRREHPFVSLNCAAMSPALIESELFGHEKGAFTGALAQRLGRFEQAERGTLFLDEVGELSLDAQAKLLRVLQEREFERVGGRRTLRTSARVVAATNRDLRELVVQGRFRADLFYRLYVLPIRVPPLRERRSDIPLLAEHFRKRCELTWGRKFNGFDPSFMDWMLHYDWPGNIRELEHVIERAFFVSDPPTLQLSPAAGPSTSPASSRNVSPPATYVPNRTEPAPDAPSVTGVDGPQRLDEVERDHILRTLMATGFRIAGPHGAAARLGLHPNTLRYRMKKLDVRRTSRP
jgi:formate hydrogenlyase transcriptional activator